MNTNLTTNTQVSNRRNFIRPIVSMIALLVVIMAGILPTASPVHAAANQDVCYVFLGGKYQGPEYTSLDDCAEMILSQGDLDDEGWRYGGWGELSIAVNTNGRVMGMHIDDKAWTELGVLDITGAAKRQVPASNQRAAGQVNISGEMVYAGTVEVSVQTYDVYGRANGVKSYSSNVQVALNAAKRNESNPFFFIIGSTPQSGAAGEISMTSAIVIDGVTFQYWSFDIDGNGNISGELTSPHNAEAIVYNLINVPQDLSYGLVMPLPAAMDEGSTMQGSVDDKTFDLVVSGAAINAMNAFKLSIEAERIR